MRLSTPFRWNIIWIWILLMFSLYVPVCLSVNSLEPKKIGCGQRNETSPRFLGNLNGVMRSLTSMVSARGSGTYSLFNDPQFSVFGLGECFVGVKKDCCRNCIDDARVQLGACIPSTAGHIYLDRCFLRYDDYDFFTEGFGKFDRIDCGRASNITNDTYVKDDYQRMLNESISKATTSAMKNRGRGRSEVRGGLITVYTSGECWRTIDKELCGECLKKAGEGLSQCAPSAEGEAKFAGCYMRYSTNKFLIVKEISPHDHECEIALAVTCAIFVAMGAFISYKRLSEKHGGLKGSLNFKYGMLEKATNSFDDSMKLGEGGAGSVFKAILPNGKAIAVKRLFFNTRQWADQFFNEVTSVSGIQHKNLVRLLGCSIEGPESLLVYEYVPNSSLDRILFVKKGADILSWSQRFNIICGTADGLAYLHGGSGVKIIHRDIKASNILLDEDLTPKIADFGLARSVSSDKSHVSTAIAGTLGYLAPEYLVRGQLTEKADVYAFGVLAIEIATGRKNTVFSQGSSSILYSVWKHYKEDNITQSIDSGLGGQFDNKEASRVLLVGLLCTQASVALRPSMAEVVKILTDKNCEVPSPNQPPFLNASVLSPEETVSISFKGSLDLESSGGKPDAEAVTEAAPV